MITSKIVLAILAGTATASSFRHLNSSELRAILAGAGPVIPESITTTESLATIYVKDHHNKWLNQPVPFTRAQIVAAIADEQSESRGGPSIHPLKAFLLSYSAKPGSASNSTRTCTCGHEHTEYRSTTLASETSKPQPAASADLSGLTLNLRASITEPLKIRLPRFTKVRATPETFIAQQTTTGEPPKITEGAEGALQNRFEDWDDHLDISGEMQTIYPTWSRSSRKWHGPQTHPKATAVLSASAAEESGGVASVTTEIVTIVTALAFAA